MGRWNRSYARFRERGPGGFSASTNAAAPQNAPAPTTGDAAPVPPIGRHSEREQPPEVGRDDVQLRGAGRGSGGSGPSARGAGSGLWWRGAGGAEGGSMNPGGPRRGGTNF
jgi:hypothetical protein